MGVWVTTWTRPRRHSNRVCPTVRVGLTIPELRLALTPRPHAGEHNDRSEDGHDTEGYNYV
jgi:uncharacterized protein YbbK (DUF523 family)